MHWSYRLADEVIEKYPDKKEYTVASGISPSGSIHIGNYREFITNYYVARALQKRGVNVKMIFSWDEYDRMRKVPKNISEKVSGFEKYIGAPYSMIPDPFGEFKSWAGRYEKEFEDALNILRMNEVPVKFVYQANEYKSGRYYNQIIHAMKNRKQIYDIITSFKTQDENENDRENYYPISIYCPTCGRDSTTVTSCSDDCTEVEYLCTCSNTSRRAKLADLDVKLVWKVDWPMRWLAEDICFEAAGIDHHAAGGSYEVASRIAREIYNHEPPHTTCFGWIGIRGLGDMHSSSGMNITPAQLLKIYEPEILRWLYAKYLPMDAFDFGFDETIVRHYAEFDKGVKGFLSGEPIDEYNNAIYALSLFDNHKNHEVLSFSTLTTIAPLAEFDEKIIKTMLEKADIKFTNESLERVAKVRFWLENYAPEKIYKLRDAFNADYYITLTQEEKETVSKLHDFLRTNHSETEIQNFLYQIINKPDLTKRENVIAQQRFFKIFYNLLFGRDDGPRLYLYLAAASKDKYLKLLKC